LGSMELQNAACYRAVLARDTRYDGRFFTCVRTTGIYCRPICPARPPKLANCTFVPSAAAAQEAGYRPCLRCRPESSPTLDAWRGTSATVSSALKLIEGGALDESDIDSLAARLQIGARQLRRLFRRHVGAAPITVAQTRRVLLAKQLIHQTQLGMTEIALASGFGSLRRFNETFQRIYGRAPSQLRQRSSGATTVSGISLLLPYRPPYDWQATLQRPATAAGGVPTRGAGDVTVGPEGTKITLGDTTVTVVATPGHTPGTLSYVFPVKDQGQTLMVAYSGGTLTGAFGTNGARWDEYVESQKRIAKAATDAGATVILSNHSEYDNAYTKARLIAARREVGENHPFVVGAEAVQRYFTVMTECATASKLRAGAK